MTPAISPVNAQTLTFFQLLEKHPVIRIPMMQRDYAQGRESASEVRKFLLAALFEALKENGKPCILDFIYGSESEGAFIPLDGQQRLTTLLLLHWYLAQKDGKQPDFKSRLMKCSYPAFTYEVRPSSRDFFTELIAFAAAPDIALCEQIKDQRWFMPGWLSDPTVQSVLKMLDAMRAADPGIVNGYDKLTTGTCPMKFHVFDLGGYPLADDLYVKMNARGKPLTDFESFKARLEEKIGEHFSGDVSLPDGQSGCLKTYFSAQMDGAWLDLFWSYAVREATENNTKPQVPDAKIMRLVREMAILSLALEAPEGWEQQLQTLRGTPKLRDLEVAFFQNQPFVQMFATLLQRWSAGCGGIQTHLLPGCPFKEEETFKKVIRNDDALSYSESVMLYAYAAYLEGRRGADIDQASFSEWMRVVFNLAENSRNDATTFKKRLEGIRNLLAQADGILNYLVGDDAALLEDFDAYQVEEERLKAGLLLRNSELWRKLILDAEAHSYFCGQIGFLFRFAGIETAGVEADALLPLFEEWWQKAAHCFAAEVIKDDGKHLWHRALLATGDYLLARGTHLLSSNRSEDFNWKRLLRGQEGEIPQSGYLKQLIEGISCDCPLPDQLDAVIKEALERSNLEEWRRLMIQWPEIIGFCEGQRISREAGTVYLLQRNDYRGRWAEIWSFALHLELKKRIGELSPFQEAGYHTARGENSCAWVVRKSQPYDDVALSIEREGDRAKLIFLRWYGKPLDPELVSLLEKSGFSSADGRYVRLAERNEAKDLVVEMAASLRRFLEKREKERLTSA